MYDRKEQTLRKKVGKVHLLKKSRVNFTGEESFWKGLVGSIYDCRGGGGNVWRVRKRKGSFGKLPSHEQNFP